MLSFDKPQKQIQKAVQAFAKGEFDKELILELEKNRKSPVQIRKKAAELGFIGIHFPEAYSGAGLGMFENAIIAEELCRKDSSLGITLTSSGYASECILRFGDNGLKETFLPKIIEGELLSGGAFTEPGNGSDISVVTTTAEKKGDTWAINGKKTFVINGGEAGIYIVLCKTDPENDSGKSLFVVESTTPGITVKDVGLKIGVNMMATADLEFENVSIPSENLIGEEGKADSYLPLFFTEMKIIVAAQALGVAQGAFDRAMVYAKGREQFNRPIAKFQAIQHKIADMATKIETARLMVYEAASRFDKKKIDAKFAAMAKITATRMAMEVTNEALQIHGGYGYMTEYEVEHFYRDAKFLEIREGNQRIQKDIIADAAIGKMK